MKLVWPVAAAAMAFGAPQLQAQQWPQRTVTIVVPFAAGGITDILARMVAERLHSNLKQTFVVENMLGAAGTIAAARVAQSTDDHLLFIGATTQMVVAPHTHKVKYNPLKDFRPVSIIGYSPLIITVNSSVPAKSLPEFVSYVKSKPGQVTYGSAGAGSLSHLGGALFARINGLQMLHVPYKGAALAFQDALAGHIALVLPTPVELKPFLDGGQLRPLAVLNSTRSSLAPGIPAISEYLQMPSVSTWNSVLTTTAASDDVVALLSREVLAAGRDPAFLAQLAKIGVEPASHSPAEFAKVIADDLALWKGIVADLGLNASN